MKDKDIKRLIYLLIEEVESAHEMEGINFGLSDDEGNEQN